MATTGDLTNSEEPILRYFSWGHLPQPLQDVSRSFAELALWIVDTIPRSAERTAALRKLLEGKDAAVRASLPPAPAYPLIPRSPLQAVAEAETAVSNLLLPDGITAHYDTTPLRETPAGRPIAGFTDPRPLADEDNQP